MFPINQKLIGKDSLCLYLRKNPAAVMVKTSYEENSKGQGF